MVNCKRVQDVLSDYIEGSLYGEDLHQIEDHVQSCPTCRILYERIHGTIRLLGSLTEISTTDSFDLRLREKIRAERSHEGNRNRNRFAVFPHLRPRPIFALAIPIVAIGLGLFLFRGSIFQEKQPLYLAGEHDQTKIERIITPPESTSVQPLYNTASETPQIPNYILSNVPSQTFDLDGDRSSLLWESPMDDQFLSDEAFMNELMNMRRPVKYVLPSAQPQTIMKTVTFNP